MDADDRIHGAAQGASGRGASSARGGFVIAIDGPAASGKGTLSRQLSRHYGFAHLDTGLLYRRVAYLVLEAGGDPADPEDAAKAAAQFHKRDVPDSLLRTRAMSMAASKVSAHPHVREALLNFQRRFAAEPPVAGQRPVKGAIIEGRDIGTIVCPAAPVKFFVTASAEVRARRRHAELAKTGDGTSYDDILADVRARDERDSTRAVAPLRAAQDAHLLDTTDLSIEATFLVACEIIDAALA